MYILGISSYYHDSAACLVHDGEIIAAAQEERFSRKKHDHRFPAQAIEYCLQSANLSIDEIDHVMDMVDLILVMTVNPGFGGQKFLTSQLDKIRTLRQRIDQHVANGGMPIDLEVDGGVDVSTAPLAAGAGADALVAGTATFRGGPAAYADNIRALRSAAEAGQ